MAKNGRTQRVLGRREVLKVAGAAALAGFGGGTTQRAFAQSARTLILTPPMTQGPYWVDEQLHRVDIRSDPTTGAVQSGYPLLLELTINQVASGAVSPLPNAYVDIWQCNALGTYSDEAVEATLGQKYLRGYQVTDANGHVQFVTIYPGWYRGRTVHIHSRIRLYDGSTTTYNYTTQFFFNDLITEAVYQTAPYNQRPNRDTYNRTDAIYMALDCMTATAEGKETTMQFFKETGYAVAAYTIEVDLALPDNSTCS